MLCIPILLFSFIKLILSCRKASCEIRLTVNLPALTPGGPKGNFGVVCDVVTSPTMNLMNVTCDVTSARVDLGKGDPLQYIYNQGYLFKTGGTAWSPVPYTSTEQLIANAWYPKTATTNISLTSTELNQPSYVLAYLCSWTESGWKYGCRDSACMQSYWHSTLAL